MRRENHNGSFWHRMLAYAAYHGWPIFEPIRFHSGAFSSLKIGAWSNRLVWRIAPGAWNEADLFSKAVLQRPGFAKSPALSFHDIEPRPK